MLPQPHTPQSGRREKPVSPLAHEILEYLRDLERGRGGYERHGVRGWATLAEIQAAVVQRRRERGAPRYEFSGGSDELRSLAAGHLVTRVDARISGATTPVWLYRIREAGVRHLEGGERRVRPPREDPDDRVYVRPGMRAALHALRHADLDQGRHEWVPGEPEWRTSRELSSWLETQRRRGEPPPIFYSDDLAGCIQAGLAERRDVPRRIYRITQAGRDLRPLEWRNPRNSYRLPRKG